MSTYAFKFLLNITHYCIFSLFSVPKSNKINPLVGFFVLILIVAKSIR